ncbi:MAG: hypothetical protein IJC39_02450, partial [Firmicutes bacterium]|nr:hypothetical protein [Bacillota bacterium]
MSWSEIIKAVNNDIEKPLNLLFGNKITYDKAGTYSFKVPAGVTEIWVDAAGGGSGGSAGITTSSSSDLAGAGGGGGECVLGKKLSVSPGQVLTITVGAGGAGGKGSGGLSSGGGATSVGGLLSLAGGVQSLIQNVGAMGGGYGKESAGGIGGGRGDVMYHFSPAQDGVRGKAGAEEYEN